MRNMCQDVLGLVFKRSNRQLLYLPDLKTIPRYMRFIQDDVAEGRKYYELKVEETKDAEEKKFYAQAMTQVELIGFINNSTLSLMGFGE